MLPGHIQADADDGQAAVRRFDYLAPVNGPEPGSVFSGHTIGGLIFHAHIEMIPQVGCHLGQVLRVNGIDHLPVNSPLKVLPAVVAQHPDHRRIHIVKREALLAEAADLSDILGIKFIGKLPGEGKIVYLQPLKHTPSVPVRRVAGNRVLPFPDFGENRLNPVPVEGIIVYRAIVL